MKVERVGGVEKDALKVEEKALRVKSILGVE